MQTVFAGLNYLGFKMMNDKSVCSARKYLGHSASALHPLKRLKSSLVKPVYFGVVHTCSTAVGNCYVIRNQMQPTYVGY